MSTGRTIGVVAASLALLLAFVGFFLSVHLYAVASASMEDTVLRGDRILVEEITARLGRVPKFGDIVAMRYPLNHAEVYVKRIVGIPGDRLHIVNKQLYRNGSIVSEPYAKHVTKYVDAFRDNFPSIPLMPLPEQAIEMLRDHVEVGQVVVPQDRYFVLGDDRDDSLDSRYFGFISRADIVGRASLVYLSMEPPPSAKIRWERFFKPL